MVQNDLVEYVSSQLKLGVARDDVRAALVGAGWAAGDVDDTMKKVEGDMKPAGAAAAAVAVGSAGAVGSIQPAGAQAAKMSESKTIRVSDLISSGAAMSPEIGAVKVGGAASPFFSKNQDAAMKAGGGDKNATADPGMAAMGSALSVAGKNSRGGSRIMTVVLIIVIILLGAFAGYLYMQNNGLASQIASLSNQGSNVSSQIANLNGQVSTLDASNTALSAQAETLAAENAELASELSFVAVPQGSSVSSAGAPLNASVAGTIGKTKTMYELTTQYGITVYVKNSSDQAISAALKPFVGATTMVTLEGSHIPGSPYMTVTSVNGSSGAVAPATTTTASSTPGSASSPAASSTASSTPLK